MYLGTVVPARAGSEANTVRNRVLRVMGKRDVCGQTRAAERSWTSDLDGSAMRFAVWVECYSPGWRRLG